MSTHRLLSDLAHVLHALPERPDPLDPDVAEAAQDGWAAWVEEVTAAREEFEADWETTLDAPVDGPVEEVPDPVLEEVARARRDMLAAEARMRLLIAYAREFVAPRPYTLDGLAQAAGMSISGVRTAYDDDEVAEVARRTGRSPRRRPAGTGGPGRESDPRAAEVPDEAPAPAGGSGARA